MIKRDESERTAYFSDRAETVEELGSVRKELIEK